MSSAQQVAHRRRQLLDLRDAKSRNSFVCGLRTRGKERRGLQFIAQWMRISSFLDSVYSGRAWRGRSSLEEPTILLI